MDVEYFNDGDRITAKVNDEEIGYIGFEIDEIPYGPYTQEQYRLVDIEVDSEHQRKGIGTALVEEAVKSFGDFSFPTPGPLNESFLKLGVQSDQYYTPEGNALIEKCIALGILNDPSDFENEEDEE